MFLRSLVAVPAAFAGLAVAARTGNTTIYTGTLAGYKYNMGPLVEQHIKQGMPLQIVREAFNEFDSKAVALFSGDWRLGYIHMEENAVLAQMLDNKVPLEARLKEFDATLPTYERAVVEIALPKRA
jgi:hypothetical protein